MHEKRRADRLTEMWSLLLWEGELSNARLCEIFDVQPVQASRLMSTFREQYPDAVRPNARHWRIHDPASAPEGADSVVEYLRLAGDDTSSVLPWLLDARSESLRVRSTHIRAIRAACVAGTGLRVKYASMSNPDGSRRLLFPHTVVRLNLRWHMRAWCAERQQFRDFNLGRLLEVSPSKDTSPMGQGDDEQWNTVVDLVLRPHRSLTPNQALMIRREHFKGTVQMRLRVRAALLQYTIQEFRAALDPESEAPPSFQLEVGNPTHISPYLFAEDR